MRSTIIPLVAAVLAAVMPAQDPPSRKLEQIDRELLQKLEAATAELTALREQIVAEKLPASRRLGEIEAELMQVRAEHQTRTRQLDGTALELGRLRDDVQARRDQAAYLSNLLGDYARGFESRLHIAELARLEAALRDARDARERGDGAESYAARVALAGASLDRLEQALGGARFTGRTVDPDGRVQSGAFLLLGPAAIFRSDDRRQVGTAEQRLGSLEPALLPFADPADAAAAAAAIDGNAGAFPIDPTLGVAHKIAQTQETLAEHVWNGGPVMVPILALGAAALFVALYRWLALLRRRRPPSRILAALYDAAERGDPEAGLQQARRLGGPFGAMLAAGFAQLGQPRERIEEAMYEVLLAWRRKLQRMLPFLAICAAAAPLLGLLGTVTGIIDTFQQITIFGSGDVKVLSGGISEALITTEFGLMVAIPSLLLHAYLMRKARGIVADLESVGLTFVQRAAMHAVPAPVSPVAGAAPPPAADPELVRLQIGEILREMLGPLVRDGVAADRSRSANARVG